MREFSCSTKLYAGPDALDALARYPAQRVLVVTDSYFSGSGLALSVGRRVAGAQVEIFDKVTPDPPAALAAEGAAVCRRFQPQLLLALGGGSPMDCAKAIRLAADMPMIFIAIPTTSGSGSEVTAFSILTHDGVKHPLVDAALRPDAAILDDSLLSDLPPHLVADTGMDLLAHGCEALAAVNRSAFSDALAMAAVQTALEKLAASYHGDRSARGDLHQAAAMAGMAFDNAGLGVCHALAHALGGAFHIPHGRLCAMLLPHVLAFNSAAALPQYAALARRCGLSAPTERMALRNLTASIVRLRTALQMPATLSQAGVMQEDLEKSGPRILEAALADRCCETNPVPVTRQAVDRILKAVSQ